MTHAGSRIFRRFLGMAALCVTVLGFLAPAAHARVFVGVGVPLPFFGPPVYYPPPTYYAPPPVVYSAPPVYVQPPAPIASAPSGAPQALPIEDRLRRLRSLCDQGLFTADQCQQRSEQILREM